MRALHRATKEAGLTMRLTPATTAISHFPRRSFSPAASTATKDDEQAVSMLMLGPFRPSEYDTRFAAIEAAAPVPVYGVALFCKTFTQSVEPIPTKTPVML